MARTVPGQSLEAQPLQPTGSVIDCQESSALAASTGTRDTGTSDHPGAIWVEYPNRLFASFSDIGCKAAGAFWSVRNTSDCPRKTAPDVASFVAGAEACTGYPRSSQFLA